MDAKLKSEPFTPSKVKPHDATLVLETRNHDNDIHTLLDYLAEKTAEKLQENVKLNLHASFMSPVAVLGIYFASQSIKST